MHFEVILQLKYNISYSIDFREIENWKFNFITADQINSNSEM